MATKVITMMLVTWCVLGLTSAHPIGAPSSVCQSMIPVHGGFKPQEGASPFQVVATPWTGRLVNVTLESSDNAVLFKGFMLQARPQENPSDGGALGTFINFDPTNSRTRNCNGGMSNSLTHISRDGKTKVEVTWVAPEEGTTDIVFLATFVQQFDIFWVGVESDVVHM